LNNEEWGRLPLHLDVLVADEDMVHVDSVKTSQVLEVVRAMEDGSWHEIERIAQGVNERVGQAVASGTVLEMLWRLADHGWIEMSESGVRMLE